MCWLPRKLATMLHVIKWYIKPAYKTQLQSNIDIEYTEVWKVLSDFFHRTKVVLFQRLQALIPTTSRKKDLIRTVENKNDFYKFINTGKELLIYPTSLEIDEIVIKSYHTFLLLQNLQNMELKKKVISESARITREETVLHAECHGPQLQKT